MRTKTVRLSHQYFINMMIFFLVALVFIVSKANIIPQEYKSIFMWIYYAALVLCGFTGVFRQEKVDESAEKALGKVYRIIWNVVLIGLLILAVVIGAPGFQERIKLTRDNICLIILIFLFFITFLRYTLFVYYDRRGLKDAGAKD
ncbi:hypothetical protein JK636_00980 [Clostridium sp. YIM B02515]|uniref:DUF2178 domain-containing protein n=1 Tax=Clostridium rhizosphaerae TaxID=2803861 RepID=A0ABS1T7J9_9CLOT|nr:hypothetical protein [Clostridium rhizosphaerae]MBL4934324.1 hypothetical protein [Clostridium rhizosphaerae]